MKQICRANGHPCGWKTGKISASCRRGVGADAFGSGFAAQICAPAESVIFGCPSSGAGHGYSMDGPIIEHRRYRGLPSQIHQPRIYTPECQRGRKPSAGGQTGDDDAVLINFVERNDPLQRGVTVVERSRIGMFGCQPIFHAGHYRIDFFGHSANRTVCQRR
jgi:hypothetical protein